MSDAGETSEHSEYADLDGPVSPGPGAPRSAVPTLVAVLATFFVAALLFLDPLGWHGLDERLRGDAPTVTGAAAESLWTCPMHPEILESEPGACPICGMDLVPASDGGSTADTTHDHDHGKLFSCGMHPQILESEPGLCPICGMDLTPVADSGGGASADDSTGGWTCPLHPSIEEAHAGECPICGTPLDAPAQGPTVALDPAVIQKMNVRTEVVERRSIMRPIRAVGTLELDQTTTSTVTPRFAGWVEAVRVHDVGQTVRKGSVLAEIYAPELVQTQEELLAAARYADRLSNAPEATREQALDLVEAARTRLDYWQVAPAAVDRLLTTGEVQRTVPIRATADGVVIERRNALDGQAVRAGDVLFRLADLGRLWLTVAVDEDRISSLVVGGTADIRFDAFPSERFAGRIRRLEPSLDPTTRTLGVRIEVPNRDRRLRSGLYASVEIAPPATDELPPVAVPTRAVLRTGTRDVVVVDLGEGRFAPREVTLGNGDGTWSSVLGGLDAGERIVTSAQFLIDSESNLRAAIEQMRAAAQTTDDADPGAHAH
ncbi:MAG: efflux RND transporter periplasmic adaptor subunit [Acidobacteriota bacterium]